MQLRNSIPHGAPNFKIRNHTKKLHFLFFFVSLRHFLEKVHKPTLTRLSPSVLNTWLMRGRLGWVRAPAPSPPGPTLSAGPRQRPDNETSKSSANSSNNKLCVALEVESVRGNPTSFVGDCRRWWWCWCWCWLFRLLVFWIFCRLWVWEWVRLLLDIRPLWLGWDDCKGG